MAGGVDPAPASSSCTSTSSASTSSADNASSPVQSLPAPPPPPSSSSAAAPPTHAASPFTAHISTPPPPLPPPTSSSSPSVPFHHAPASHQQLHHLHPQHSPHPNLQQRLFSGHSPAATPSTAADRHVRDDCWSEEATKALIQAWGERYMELNRGNLKQKHWKDVALCVNRRGGGGGGKAPKTDVQCKNRLDTLKKKYKIEKSKLVMGGTPSKWAFFNSLDALIGPSKKPTKLSAPPKHPPICLDERSHDTKPSPSLPFLSQIANPHPHPNPNPNPNLYLNPFPSPNLNRLPHSNPDANPYPDPNSTLNNPNPDQNPNSHPKTGHFPFPDPNPSPAADTASKSRSSSSLHGRRKPSRGKRRAASCCDSDSGSFGDLASAIMRLAEAYERVEMVKQQQMLELEKQRMELAKDLEIRRLQLFTQTQVELAKLKHGKGKQNSTGSYSP